MHRLFSFVLQRLFCVQNSLTGQLEWSVSACSMCLRCYWYKLILSTFSTDNDVNCLRRLLSTIRMTGNQCTWTGFKKNQTLFLLVQAFFTPELKLRLIKLFGLKLIIIIYYEKLFRSICTRRTTLPRLNRKRKLYSGNMIRRFEWS